MAVLMVLVGHQGVPAVARFATSGVSLFFVLSGFLITSRLLQEADEGAIGLTNFYARRLLRLGPALVVCIGTVALWARYDRAVSAPATSALFLSNVDMGAGRSLGLLSHMWSLSMEEQFYLVWPLILIAALGISRRAACAVALCGATLSLATAAALVVTGGQGVHWERVRFSPDTRAYGLFLGCALALGLSMISWKRVHMLVAPALVACLVASSRTDESSWQYLFWRPVVTIAGAIFVVALLDDSSIVSRAASWRPLRYIGRISYGLYLWHFPVIGIIAVHLRSTPLSVRAFLAVTISVALASLSYHALERPLLRLQVRFRSSQCGSVPQR